MLNVLKISNHTRGQWFCKECITNYLPKYNPFDSSNCDKYNQFDLQQIEDIETISKILNSCKILMQLP